MMGDRVFQVVSILCLAGVVGASVLHFLAAGRRIRAAGPAGDGADMRRFGLIERLVFLGFAATFLVLAASGLAPGVLYAARLTGWLLMLHVGTGGAFLAFLLLLAVFWAEDCRFERHDAQWCRACCRGRGESAPAGRFDAGQKFTFWAALALGAGTTVTMMISMLPVFGPDGLEVLREIHRYCGLVFVMVAYVHFYQTVIVRRGRLRWLVSGRVNSDWARHYHPNWRRPVRGEEGK